MSSLYGEDCSGLMIQVSYKHRPSNDNVTEWTCVESTSMEDGLLARAACMKCNDSAVTDLKPEKRKSNCSSLKNICWFREENSYSKVKTSVNDIDVKSSKAIAGTEAAADCSGCWMERLKHESESSDESTALEDDSAPQLDFNEDENRAASEHSKTRIRNRWRRGRRSYSFPPPLSSLLKISPFHLPDHIQMQHPKGSLILHTSSGSTKRFARNRQYLVGEGSAAPQAKCFESTRTDDRLVLRLIRAADGDEFAATLGRPHCDGSLVDEEIDRYEYY